MGDVVTIPKLRKDLLLEISKDLSCCFSLVDMNAPDQPLIAINNHFISLTGYAESDILNRNCRFLQGELSNPRSIEAIRNSLIKRFAVFQDLINYRKDGSMFWNRLILLPVELKNEGLHFIGLQHDVTRKKMLQGFGFECSDIQSVDTLEIMDSIYNPLSVLLMHKSFEEMEMENTEARKELVVRAQRIIVKLSESIYSFDD